MLEPAKIIVRLYVFIATQPSLSMNLVSYRLNDFTTYVSGVHLFRCLSWSFFCRVVIDVAVDIVSVDLNEDEGSTISGRFCHVEFETII